MLVWEAHCTKAGSKGFAFLLFGDATYLSDTQTGPGMTRHRAYLPAVRKVTSAKRVVRLMNKADL